MSRGPISRSLADALERSSWIRRMFEEGLRLKAEHGAENVADLSLGNPVVEPPPAVRERLRALVDDPEPGAHRYMPNAGRPSTRAAVAGHLARQTAVPYEAAHVLMGVGAGGCLNVAIKAVADPGDEVICLAPYFVEYGFYVTNHGPHMVVVQTDARFRPDPEALEAAITQRTRAVLVNSPNNPTGVVYDAADWAALADVLRRASARHGAPIYLISDEPYRALAYDGVEVPWPVAHYRDVLHVTSFSKDLALPGERIGYVAVNPATPGAEDLVAAFACVMRMLGYVNAPALQQRLVEGLLDVRVDLDGYRRHRAMLLEALDAAGYEVVRPDGAFYVFPKVPGDGDDVAFARACMDERLLVVPGSGFGRPGHFRLSYAVQERDVEMACEALGRVARR